jgi:NitT/TauT family transport system ATP-binding protein
MASQTAIQVVQLTHAFATIAEEITAIQLINLSVAVGEFLVLVGPSGCGKSTLLSLMAGIFPPTSGEIFLFGQAMFSPSAHTGYMLQKDGLLDWRTVEQNALFALQIRRKASKESIAHTHHLLEQMGLSHVRHQLPSQLSGGMRQRVALARTLAVQPDILLLDEPFSALDIQTKLQLEELLVHMLHEHQKTAVLVTHDLEEALAVGDRIMVMGGRPGQMRYTLQVPAEIRKLSPFAARGHPLFRPLFHELWKEIEKR